MANSIIKILLTQIALKATYKESTFQYHDLKIICLVTFCRKIILNDFQQVYLRGWRNNHYYRILIYKLQIYCTDFHF